MSVTEFSIEDIHELHTEEGTVFVQFDDYDDVKTELEELQDKYEELCDKVKDAYMSI